VEGFRTWSVGTDGGVVTAALPEPLRFPSGPVPDWMSRCASAIRDDLRALPVADGTILEATLAGAPRGAVELADALLYNPRIPEAQVAVGVRLRAARGADCEGIVQRYRRVPAAAVAGEDEPAVRASLQVPIAGVFELDSARLVWLAVRRVAVGTLPVVDPAPPGGLALHVRLATGSDRERGSTELIKRLLDGVRASFQVYAGENPAEAARRLGGELRAGESEVLDLLNSPRAGLLGAGDRFGSVELEILASERPQLEIELRDI
jgi:hypothetical protein